uniref:hypothetical protein n=1 Tax=Bifidobacterium magnum TaxID=1692 RepID=UPI001362D505
AGSSPAPDTLVALVFRRVALENKGFYFFTLSPFCPILNVFEIFSGHELGTGLVCPVNGSGWNRIRRFIGVSRRVVSKIFLSVKFQRPLPERWELFPACVGANYSISFCSFYFLGWKARPLI